MMDLRIERIESSGFLYEQAKGLRNEVLRKPLGLILSPEELLLDADREHLVAVAGEWVVGSVSLYMQEPGLLRIKQMAVDPAQQGLGIGAKLMDAAEARGRELGAERVTLNARCTALKFYDRQGYSAQGDEFLEQGIPHRIMVKRMTKSLA